MRAALIAAGIQVKGLEGRLAGLEANNDFEVNVRRLRSLALDVRMAGQGGRKTCEQARDAALIDAAEGRFKAAVAEFADLDPTAATDPWCIAELAAHGLALASAEGDPLPLLRTLPSPEVDFGPAAPLSAFNRAVALEALGLPVPAARELERVAARDASGALGSLARERSQAILQSDPIEMWLRSTLDSPDASDISGGELADRAGDFPHLARRAGLEVVLPAAGRDLRAGRVAKALDTIRVLEQMGRSLEIRGGDPTLLRAAVEARSFLQPGLSSERFWQGISSYSAARALQTSERFAGARKRFRDAEMNLAKVHSVVRSWADYGIAACDFHLGDWSSSSRRLRSLEAGGGQAPSALQAHVSWSQGVIADLSGDLKSASTSFDQAIDRFKDLGEIDGFITVSALRAHVLLDLGREKESRQDIWRALLASSQAWSTSAIELLLDGGLRLLSHRSAPASTWVFEDELLRNGLASRRTSSVVHAYLMRGSNPLHSDRDRLAALDRADDAAAAIEDERERRRKSGLIAMARGELLLSPRPSEARFQYQLADAEFAALGLGPLRIPALRALGRAWLREGSEANAEQALQTALQELTRQQALESDWASRVELLGEAQGLFSELAALKLARGDSGGALAVSDQGRSSAILAALNSHLQPIENRHILTAEDFRAIPSGTSILVSLVLNDGIQWWLLEHDRLDTRRVSIPRAELKRLVSSLTDAFSNGDPAAATLGREFTARVLRDVDWSFLRAERLVVVPDPELFDLPWAFLPDPLSGRPFIDDRPVTISPSVAVYKHLQARDHHRLAPRSIRAIGGPELDARLFPDLDTLPNARGEAEATATAYPDQELLLGSKATCSAVLARPLPEVLHFAGHSLSGADGGRPSALVLAPDTACPSGILSASRIGSESLSDLRIVVLSSCASARGAAWSAEGQLGLAQAFLAAGVPTVIATLWPVEDDLASAVSERLHQLFRDGLTPSSALRALALCRGGNGETCPSLPLTPFIVLGAGH